MKRRFTMLMMLVLSILSNYAIGQTTTYGDVLYRVNAGGTQKQSIDTSTVEWSIDNLTNPSPYVDVNTMGNKIYATHDSVSLNGSVPVSTHYALFKSERTLENWNTPALEYNFPVPAGQQVEVRLYFAEIYFEQAGMRIFDIALENSTMIASYDIFAEAGHDVGVMKKFIVTSDGNLDIDLKRIKQQPKINGIEIIEVKDVQVAGLFEKNEVTSLSVYPNPFQSSFTIDLKTNDTESIQLFDGYGREIPGEQMDLSGNTISVNLENHPKGIYYIKVVDKNTTGTARVIKE